MNATWVRRVGTNHLLSLLLLFGMGGVATAGPNEPANECLVGFDGVPADDENGGTVECDDCDPSCDFDNVSAKNGRCTFRIAVCLNNDDPSCTPGDIRNVRVRGNGVNANRLTPDPDGTNAVCSPDTEIVVRTKHGKSRPGAKTLRARAVADIPSRVDGDKLRLVCRPNPGDCPSPTTSTTGATTSTTGATTSTSGATTSTTTATTSTTIPALCDNGVLDPGEECDPPGSITCPPGSPAGAFLMCNGDCSCPVPTTTTTVGSTTTTETTISVPTTTETTSSVPTTTETTSSVPTTTETTSSVPTTTETTSSVPTTTVTTTTIPGPTCCAAAEIVTQTSAGVLVVDSLNAFPFPAGVLTNINAGEGDADCRHDATITTFNVPPFCIVGLGFTSDVFPLGCASGNALGSGSVWDASSANPTPNIFRVADTSDGTCNPAGQPCNTAAGGAGANTLGDIDATRGGGPAQPTGVVHTQIDIPVRSLTWSDSDGTPDCPDEDGVYDSGQDNTITDFNFILSPTTGQTRAQFVDKNADSCSVAGGGPGSTRICSNDSARPCSFTADCAAPGTCAGGPLQGSAPAGPCCEVGQATTVVATGNAFSGAGPLFDLIFMNSSPTTISACNAFVADQTCTLTTDPCAD